jgi:flagellar protein FlaF
METVLVSIICIALLVFGGMTMSQGFMTSVDAGTAGLSEIGQQTEAIMRTSLTPISTHLTLVIGPDPLEIVLENTGQTKMADFDKWDVIVQYYDDAEGYQVKWLPYSASGAGVNEWGIVWIRLNDEPEKFEPNVLNPGEQIMIEVLLNPSVSNNATNMVVISTPSGITCSTYFSP